jgi:putative tryptophan/tyrosine transport system substrate-binding protein
MKTREILLSIAVAFVLLTVPLLGDAQQPTKVPKIGILLGQTASLLADRMDALRQGLRELGYNEGKNITFEYRYAEGDMNRFPSFADEMVRLKVDIILAGGGTPCVLASKKATSTIPIIFIGSGDPVAARFVPSLERPGGNVTGLGIGYPGEYGDRAKLLKETVPSLSRMGLLFNSTQSSVPVDELRNATPTLAIQLQPLDVRNSNDFDSAFETATKTQVGGLIVANNIPMTTYPKRIVELAAKSRLPVLYSENISYEAGGLMASCPSFPALYRRSATYIDKILKGANPGDLPVELPKKLDLLINLKAAEQIGLTIPQSVLNRADAVFR